MKEYDKAYLSKNFFGKQADGVLLNHYQKIRKNGKVLDIGIGQGRNAFFLIQNSYSVDGIDPSQTAIDELNAIIALENIPLRVFQTDFGNFDAKGGQYDAILIFGLVQILSETQIRRLFEKSSAWLKNEGLVYLTGFTKHEQVFMPRTQAWKKISDSSFTDHNGNFRTFLNASELELFIGDFNFIHKWEGWGKKHRHGDGKEEQHHYFELILRKTKYK